VNRASKPSKSSPQPASSKLLTAGRKANLQADRCLRVAVLSKQSAGIGEPRQAGYFRRILSGLPRSHEASYQTY